MIKAEVFSKESSDNTDDATTVRASNVTTPAQNRRRRVTLSPYSVMATTSTVSSVESLVRTFLQNYEERIQLDEEEQQTLVVFCNDLRDGRLSDEHFISTCTRLFGLSANASQALVDVIRGMPTMQDVVQNFLQEHAGRIQLGMEQQRMLVAQCHSLGDGRLNDGNFISLCTGSFPFQAAVSQALVDVIRGMPPMQDVVQNFLQGPPRRIQVDEEQQRMLVASCDDSRRGRLSDELFISFCTGSFGFSANASRALLGRIHSRWASPNEGASAGSISTGAASSDTQQAEQYNYMDIREVLRQEEDQQQQQQQHDQRGPARPQTGQGLAQPQAPLDNSSGTTLAGFAALVDNEEDRSGLNYSASRGSRGGNPQ